MATTLTSPTLSTDDLCAREPIHTPGNIQPHGLLLVLDPADNFAIAAASANAAILTPDGNLFSHSCAALFGPEFDAALRRHAAAGALRPEMPWEINVETNVETNVTGPSSANPGYTLAAHEHAGLIILELEPANPADAQSALDATRQLQRAIARLRACNGSLNELALEAAEGIRRITGYERVIVYRFDRDWNGSALAEDIVPDWPQRLGGLHFPASDIPAQARALYRTSLLRWVPSRDASPIPLRLAPGRTAPVDLSHAHLRALSPIHLQYHRNMGVDGSMSLSMLVGGQLWGLVVCHHRQPHRTSSAQRAAAAALADALSLRVGPAERAGHEAARGAEQRRTFQLIAQMAQMGQLDDLAATLTAGPTTVLELFSATGAAVIQDDRAATLGATPPPENLQRLCTWLRTQAAPGAIYATDTLPADMPGWTDAAVASGLLALSITEDRSDMLLWFRPEQPREVSWGGNPNKQQAAAGDIVLPRQSFDRWVELRRGHARPWQEWELEIADLLHHAITDVILRHLRRIGSLNDQLRQSQKMEAVGQLTGGLAHDFNNLLGGITGSLELARARLAQGRIDTLDRYLAAAAGAAGRAAALTHRLLAFSRRQTLDPKPVDVNALIRSMEDLVRRTVGPAITLDCITSPGLWTILCDANQLENALLNLSINARDAMPTGGRLTIEASNVRLDDAYAQAFAIPPGHYVAVSVSDTGIGMSRATIERAFEPFFTTKPLGAGTGLGLSMVYGFTKQSGGHARIYSELGHGTTVRLYHPRHEGKPAAEVPRSNQSETATPGAATILLVDDEPVLRMLVCEVLREAGYTVIEATDGPTALALLENGQPVDLLISDVGLPGGLNGRQVAEAARTRRPGLRVLFITGYAENAALSGGLLNAATQVLTKPFEMAALNSKVQAMLDWK